MESKYILLFVASLATLSSAADRTEKTYFKASERLKLMCGVASGVDKPAVVWKKDGAIIESSDRLSLNKADLVIATSRPSDAGNYTCQLAEGGDTIAFEVIGNLPVKLERSFNAVEDEKLVVRCVIKASTMPSVTWKIPHLDNMTIEANTTITTGVGEEKVEMPVSVYEEKNEKEGDGNKVWVLRIDRVQKAIGGEYECRAVNAEDGATGSDTTTVRVKDKYAALWPFLGICAEVFVLCTIILIYEKKRNKTEMDDSDTDQGNDAKNDGKDSTLRHRN